MKKGRMDPWKEYDVPIPLSQDLPCELHDLDEAMKDYLQGRSHAPQRSYMFPRRCGILGLNLDSTSTLYNQCGQGYQMVLMFIHVHWDKGIKRVSVMTADDEVFKEVGDTLERERSFGGCPHE